MRRATTFCASALLALASTAASAGSLDFWEASRGARDVTAYYPTGAAQQAFIYFDASSAEQGGLAWGPSEVELRPTGSVHFTDFNCVIAGCNGSDWAMGPTADEPFEFVRVTDPDSDEKHGVYHLGTITFDAPQEPGTMPLVKCKYTSVDFVERTCSQFVLVTLPEPSLAALFAGAALLAGLRVHRRTR